MEKKKREYAALVSHHARISLTKNLRPSPEQKSFSIICFPLLTCKIILKKHSLSYARKAVVINRLEPNQKCISSQRKIGSSVDLRLFSIWRGNDPLRLRKIKFNKMADTAAWALDTQPRSSTQVWALVA